jgi:hypothetical protein
VLSFIKTTGLFTGAFLQGGKSRIFGGVVLQKTIGAAGQYSDGEATHAVSLAPFP